MPLCVWVQQTLVDLVDYLPSEAPRRSATSPSLSLSAMGRQFRFNRPKSPGNIYLSRRLRATGRLSPSPAASPREPERDRARRDGRREERAGRSGLLDGVLSVIQGSLHGMTQDVRALELFAPLTPGETPPGGASTHRDGQALSASPSAIAAKLSVAPDDPRFYGIQRCALGCINCRA